MALADEMYEPPPVQSIQPWMPPKKKVIPTGATGPVTSRGYAMPQYGNAGVVPTSTIPTTLPPKAPTGIISKPRVPPTVPVKPGATPAVAPTGVGNVAAPANGQFDMQWAIDQYNKAQQDARAANEQRYGDILGQYQGLIKDQSQNTQQWGQGLLDQAAAQGQGLLAGYDDRYKRNMDYLANAGQQEASDIRADWASNQAQAEQNLRKRGLAGTTILNNARTGVTRNLNADLSRQNERLQQQRLQTDAQLSGDKLSAQNAYNSSMTGLANQIGQYGLNQYQGLVGDKLGFMERRDDAYPDLSQFASMIQKLGANGGGNGTGTDGAGGTGANGGATKAPAKPRKEVARTFVGIDASGGNVYRIKYDDGSTGTVNTKNEVRAPQKTIIR